MHKFVIFSGFRYFCEPPGSCTRCSVTFGTTSRLKGLRSLLLLSFYQGLRFKGIHNMEMIRERVSFTFDSMPSKLTSVLLDRQWLVQPLRKHPVLSRDNCSSVCVYSNSRNDVARAAQRYGTIAAHTRRRASVPVVFVVFCVHMHSFAGLIRRTPPPTFSDNAITDRHSDTTIFQLRAHWVQISWSIGSEKSFGHVPPVGVEPSTSCMQGEHPIH